MRREQQQAQKFEDIQSDKQERIKDFESDKKQQKFKSIDSDLQRKAAQTQSSNSQTQSVNQVMLQLEQLSSEIENNPHYASEQLNEYIRVYVQNHNRSEELFNLMCEHNMLAKLFTGGGSRPMYILEGFNLLLANTQRVHELIYIFSHPLFHSYLLINVQTMLQPINTSPGSSSGSSSVILASHQCIQYYIQLIKTLITKLQGQSRQLQEQSRQCTLLKLFCNSKYSYYPLLTNCIVLAIRRNVKQELVRVTAQHCILQLMGIMSRKQVGECYFSSLHMLVFFYEIIRETIEEETHNSSSNQDTTIKYNQKLTIRYLTDLLKAINLSYNHQVTIQQQQLGNLFYNNQAKEKSFILFFTIMSNLLTFNFIKNPAPALHLLLKFSNSLTQIYQLKEMPKKYLTPIYFIFGKLLFNKYLNNITLSSIILSTQAISQLSQLEDVNILKIIKTHYEKNPLLSSQIQVQNQRNSYQEEQRKRQSLQLIGFRNSMIKIKQQVFQKQYQHLVKQMEKYNMDNQEFFSLKQNFYKKTSQTNSNWLFGIGNIFKKINIFDIPSNQYIKRLSHLAAIKYQHQHPIKFLDEVSSPSAVYIYEFLKIKNKERYFFGQRTEDSQKIQISFNQNRDQFACTTHFFKTVMNIADLAQTELDSSYGLTNRLQLFQKLQRNFNPKLQHLGQVYFTLHFRQYFQHSIFQYICTSTNAKPRIQLNPKTIKYFYNLASALLFDLSEMNLNKLKSQALKLQKELYSIINQKGFDAFCDYLQSDQQKHMVQSGKKPSMNASVIKFDKRQSTDDSKKMNSSARKKKSIFKSFTKSSTKDSPKKNPINGQLKQSQTLKIVQTKMLHLQLLRFLLEQPQMGSKIKSFQQRLPLYKIFQKNFSKKYNLLSQKSKEQQILYQAEKVGFNSESDYECTFRVRVNLGDFSIVCELLHQQKLILKCNIKEFLLLQSQTKEQKQKQSSTHSYLINLHPTTNTLGFNDIGRAIELLNTVNEIKFGYRQTKDLSILQYLNKQNQIQK